MAFEMKLPDLATTGSDVRVIRWLVDVGQPVRRGDLLVEVETDKAAMEVEAVTTGVLTAIFAHAGDEVSAGQVIATIADAPSAADAPPAEEAQPVEDTQPARVGLFARNRQAAPPADRPAAIALSASQRTIARRMQESKQSVPHFYLQTSFNADPIITRRAASDQKLAWDAFFVYAAARALKKHERMKCRYEEDQLAPFAGDSIGVAVDLAGELFVLSVTDIDGKSPESISADIRLGVEGLRSAAPEYRRLQAAALTITNLGATKVESFFAIVNPPEASIMAIGKIAPVPVVEEGQIIIQSRAQITLSVDHRVVNGKYAAEFLSSVVDELEGI